MHKGGEAISPRVPQPRFTKMWTQLERQSGSRGVGLRGLRKGLISRWNEDAGDVNDGDYNDGLQNEDSVDRIARAPPSSPTARQGRSPIGRSNDSSGTSMAHERKRGAYSWGWKTCRARVGRGGRWPSSERQPKRRSRCRRRQGQQQQPLM